MDDLIGGLIDSHAHVWDRNCIFVPGARYHPGYEATIDSYLSVLDQHGIERAVLVQPSFLGTDNSYLLKCLRTHPDRLRGIVVVEPAISETRLQEMAGNGVIGHRFNLLSMNADLLATDQYQDLITRAAGLNWWTEVQSPGRLWPKIVPELKRAGANVMIDHFGLPTGTVCGGIEAIRMVDPARHSLKLSAPYRQTSRDFLAAIRPWLDDSNSPRLLWGSDWPWTQHEDRHTYQECMAWLEKWTTEKDRRDIASAHIPLNFRAT